MESRKWWTRLDPDALNWLIEHQGDRVSWHIIAKLRNAAAQLLQPDSDVSDFYLTDNDWAEIAMVTEQDGPSR